MSFLLPDDQTAALNRWLLATWITVVFASCTSAAPTSDATTTVAPSKPSPCAVKSDCAGGACDPASHTCVDCLQDADCSSPGQVCLDGQCKAGKTCTSSVACKATAQVCNTGAGHCVDCMAEADCAAGMTCLATKCVAKTTCSSDVQCATVCALDLGFCVRCNKSADCAAGHWCAADHACHASMCDAGACLGTAGPSATWLACNPDGSGYATPKTCDDEKACTVDTCVPASGCANAQTPGVDCSEPATCTFDGKADGQETDVDCGGAICPHCASGAKCTVALDCLSQSCGKGVCSGDPGCVDGKTSGKETDTDCGGGDCKPCADNKKCIGGSDCASFVCVNKSCAAASCTDQVKNGQETASDCGGGSCPACASGKACSAASDCASAICKNGACQTESCSDKTLNGNETDIDCGGTTCPKCPHGHGCKAPADCVAAGDACSVSACASGKCTTTGKDCGDANICTADSCDGATGKCVNTISPAACEDNNACTAEMCGSATGCTHKAIPDGSTCDLDGSKCTPDACKAGACSKGPALNCDDKNSCTSDSCNPMTGLCLQNTIADKAACDDGNGCTTGDACIGGTCLGSPVVCTASDQCHIAGSCSGGICSNPSKASWTPCNDGDSCTTNDICTAGACNGTLNCDDGNSCTVDNCNTSGACTHAAVAPLICGDGTCSPGETPASCPKDCIAVVDQCLQAKCTTSYPKCASDPACLAGLACVEGGKQVWDCVTDWQVGLTLGQIQSCGTQSNCFGAATTSNCSDGDPCTTADLCTNGTCAGLAKNCDDSNACTADSCSGAGTCAHTAASSCDDGNVCTTDSCDAVGCQHANASGSCADGNACTTGDVCAGGACVGVTTACDDKQPCTIDSCIAQTGLCAHVNLPDASTCDDADPCMLGDACVLGVCAPGTTPATKCSGTDVCALGQCTPLPPEMAIIPAGIFKMGCVPGDLGCAPDEIPQHTVLLGAFFMDVYEVTVAKYKLCVADGSCTVPTSASALNWGVAGKEQHPVNGVTWDQAAAYCKWSNITAHLPTEAQWEKAARGGLDGSIYPWGDAPPTCTLGQPSTASFQYGCDGNVYPGGTQPVGTYSTANGYGLYDMAGNVTEWVSDFYCKGYYSTSPISNPAGPSSCWSTISVKVYRGGGYSYPTADLLHTSRRSSANAISNDPSSGFRCVRSAP